MSVVPNKKATPGNNTLIPLLKFLCVSSFEIALGPVPLGFPKHCSFNVSKCSLFDSSFGQQPKIIWYQIWWMRYMIKLIQFRLRVKKKKRKEKEMWL